MEIYAGAAWLSKALRKAGPSCDTKANLQTLLRLSSAFVDAWQAGGFTGTSLDRDYDVAGRAFDISDSAGFLLVAQCKVLGLRRMHQKILSERCVCI